jgi:hypothetical protein
MATRAPAENGFRDPSHGVFHGNRLPRGPRHRARPACHALLTAAVTLLSAVGCGPKDARLAIKGVVTLDGEPVASGVVSFFPMTPSAGTTVAGAAVSQGRYELQVSKGLPPGDYRVEIRIPRPTGRTAVDPATGESTPEVREAAPARYNEESELRVTVAPGTGDLDFLLESSGAEASPPVGR